MTLNHIVIITPDEVVIFDEIHTSLPYIKKCLKSWDIYDSEFQTNISNIKGIEDALNIIDVFNIPENFVSIYIVDKVNPEVTA